MTTAMNPQIEQPTQPMAMSDVNVTDLVEKATIQAESIGEVSPSDLAHCLEEYTFCRITGLVKQADIRAARKRLADQFTAENDHPVIGEDASMVSTNFQKLAIGHRRASGNYWPRFARIIYNPIMAPDIYGLREAFVRTAQIRNLCMGQPVDFAVSGVDDGMWTCSRIHHYPAGGGFMSLHRDVVAPSVVSENGIAGGFYQPLVLLTQKGEDFDTGGGVAEIDGHVVEYEDYANMGDIVVYNDMTQHGVNDIDPHKLYQQDSLAGRMGGLVTLFKKR